MNSMNINIHQVKKVKVSPWEKLSNCTDTKDIIIEDEYGSKTVITLFRDR